MAQSGSQWVRLDVPDRFRMGPERIAELCRWRTRREGGGLLVCLEERYSRSRPRLLVPNKLADASNAAYSTTYAALAAWPRQDEFRGEWGDVADAEWQSRLGSSRIEEWLYGWQLMVLTARDTELPRLVQTTFAGTVLENLPGASLWALQVDPSYHWRSALIRVLFGALEAPELLNRTPDEFKGFAAGRELAANISFGLDSLVEPALMATAPWVLGVASGRIGGALVLLFGDPIPGVSDTPAPDLLRLFQARASSEATSPASRPPPNTETGATEMFLRWWAERLNLLFSVVLDPARFADSSGLHDARSHFATLLSLERLFGCLQALLAATARDEFVRQLLFFDVLDLLEGLRFGGYRTLLTVRHARRALDRVRSTGGGAVAPAVPTCERGVEALERVADGFYLTERRTDAGLRVKRRGGEWEEISMEHAVADFLRLVRNSTHSFMDSVTDDRDVSLLSAHTGAIPENLPDLALLYVLDLLLTPLRLAREQ